MSTKYEHGNGGELLIYPAGDGVRVLMTGETVC